MNEKRFINAIDFLIFSYWGFSIGEKTKDETDTIIDKIVSKAYSDAAGQKAFNALIERENETLSDSRFYFSRVAFCYVGELSLLREEVSLIIVLPNSSLLIF